MSDKLMTEKQTAALIGKALGNLEVKINKLPSHTFYDLLPDAPFGFYGGTLSQLNEITTGNMTIFTCDETVLTPVDNDSNLANNSWLTFEYYISGYTPGTAPFLTGYIHISHNNSGIKPGTYPTVVQIVFGNNDLSNVSIYIPYLGSHDSNLSWDNLNYIPLSISKITNVYEEDGKVYIEWFNPSDTPLGASIVFSDDTYVSGTNVQTNGDMYSCEQSIPDDKKIYCVKLVDRPNEPSNAKIIDIAFNPIKENWATTEEVEEAIDAKLEVVSVATVEETLEYLGIQND